MRRYEETIHPKLAVYVTVSVGAGDFSVLRSSGGGTGMSAMWYAGSVRLDPFGCGAYFFVVLRRDACGDLLPMDCDVLLCTSHLLG